MRNYNFVGAKSLLIAQTPLREILRRQEYIKHAGTVDFNLLLWGAGTFYTSVNGNIFRTTYYQMTDPNSKLTKAKIDNMFRLGYKLAFETKEKKKKWKDIFSLWYCAATNGHLRAQFYLGTCYDFGNGTKKNVSEAFNWYMTAAKRGKMEAQYNVGFFYKKGELVKRDYKKAVHWYTLAARQGDTEAQRDLGYCYFYGQGVKKDNSKAVYWYKKAADKADEKAMYNLGLCYEFGDGVKLSNRWAKHYYSKASKLGHKNASDKLKRLK